MEYLTIPTMSVQPNLLVFYDQRPNAMRRSKLFGDDLKMAPTDNAKYTGLITKSTAKRLRYVINLLVAQAKWKTVRNPYSGKEYKFKINFITLTLSGPQESVTDKQIKSEMLKPFLRRLRRRAGLRSYVWRAERQKNSRLHFHITSDTYIDLNIIRDEWNRQQSKFHFIDYYRSRNDAVWPNSTDVHSVKDIENLAGYLVKYMAKEDPDAQQIEGRLWDCSTNLKTKEKLRFEMGKPEFELLEKLQSKYELIVPEDGYCALMPIPEKEFKLAIFGPWLNEYNEYLENIYRAADSRHDI